MEVDVDSSSEEEQNEVGTSKKSKKRTSLKRLQKYKAEWEKLQVFSGWLSSSKKGREYAYCKACNSDISVKGGKGEIVKHSTRQMHVKAAKAMKLQKCGTETTGWTQANTLQQKITNGEIRLAGFIAEHNLALNVMEHLPKLIQAICPDSEIAKGLQCGRTKTTAVVTNVIGKSAFETLCDQLKSKMFSIIVDESTDLSTIKHLCIVVTYLNRAKKKIEDHFLALIEVKECDAQSLYQQIVTFFEEHKLPYKTNMIGFGSDGANVMFGCNLSVLALFKKCIPHLFSLKCICHSFSLVASYACQKLPPNIEDLVRNIYNYLNCSPKRCSIFREFQEFLLLKPHKILHPSQTRWLSLQQVVNRVLEQYEALRLFFIDAAVNDNLPSAANILKQLNNIETRLYLEFLNYILPLLNNLNKEFQSESPQIHHLFERVCTVLKTLFDCFIKPNILRNKDLHEINANDPHSYLPIEEIYLGANVNVILLENQTVIDKTTLHNLRLNCLQFYIEATKQIVKRFKLKDNVLQKLKVLDPHVALSGEVRSLSELAMHFPNLVDKTDLQNLDSEWRTLRNCNEAKQLISNNNYSVEHFWFAIQEMTYGSGTPTFPLLSKFMLSMLCLPHSSANVERIFSKTNLIKTKPRNRISTTTLSGLLHSQYVVENCFNFQITPEMTQKMKVDIYKK